MTRINLTVDGDRVSDDVEPRLLLVQYLRERLGKTGTVIGCDTSNCGACTVHLDLHTSSVDTLLALGATRAPGYGGDPWTVLLDPEGNELCAFEREGELAAYLGHELTVDSRDPEAQARWWASVFGVEPRNDDDPWWYVAGVPGMPLAAMLFDPVPEPKTVKNRMHWDIYGDVADLLGRGATLLEEQPRWTVLADPEGNEFCVFPPAPRPPRGG